MNRYDRGFAAITATMLGGLVALVFAIVAIGNRIDFPAQVADIEAIRHDAALVDPAQAEDVIGQVTAANRTIASKQAYNRIPLVCLVIPNGWDDIEPIPVPMEP